MPSATPAVPPFRPVVWQGDPVRRTLQELVVIDALVASYPLWTDEHGTNVRQLAEIAVQALEDHGLLRATPDGDAIELVDDEATTSRR